MGAPTRRDIAVAVLLGVVSEAELQSTYAFEHTSVRGPSVGHLIVPVLVAAALALRRRYPLVVAPVVTGLFALEATVLGWPNTYAPIAVEVVSVFSLAAYRPTTRAAVVPAVLVLTLGVFIGAADEQDPIGSSVTGVVLTAGVWVAGTVVRRNRARAEVASRERDAAQQRMREIAASERARIARELHDVVAHGMSVVVLQARGGRRRLDDVVVARRAFDDIERVASECLDEMRRLLGILRTGGSPDVPLAPQPKVDELDALVERARASGADVALEIVGDRHELPPAIELSVFRIAQEALTNSLKHAPGSRARLELVYDTDCVTVTATDDGPGGPVDGDGHGLIGMRERVALFGGTFAAGSRDEGGFAVRACLPLGTGA